MVRDGLEKFRRAADAAGYDSDERSGMFKRFSGIDDGDTFGRDGSGKFSREVKKNHLLGFFRNFLESSLDPSYRGDWNDLSDLGQILHDFSAEIR